MDELIKLWVLPEYLPMLLAVAVFVKLVAVPFIKGIISGNRSACGYTSIWLAYGSSVAMSFAYKALLGVGAWTPKDITMTVIVGILAAFSSIGLNVSTAAIRGNDVSINK